MTCILGVDPGLTGALAFYYTDAPHSVLPYDMPLVDGTISPALLANILDQHKPDAAYIEMVSAMPGQGVSSMFNFGRAYGTAIGVIGITTPIHFVTPSKWKKTYGLSSDKEECRARALQLFPGSAMHFARKKDHGRAEAALIARYGAQLTLKVAA